MGQAGNKKGCMSADIRPEVLPRRYGHARARESRPGQRLAGCLALPQPFNHKPGGNHYLKGVSILIT